MQALSKRCTEAKEPTRAHNPSPSAASKAQENQAPCWNNPVLFHLFQDSVPKPGAGAARRSTRLKQPWVPKRLQRWLSRGSASEPGLGTGRRTGRAASGHEGHGLPGTAGCPRESSARSLLSGPSATRVLPCPSPTAAGGSASLPPSPPPPGRSCVPGLLVTEVGTQRSSTALAGAAPLPRGGHPRAPPEGVPSAPGTF